MPENISKDLCPPCINYTAKKLYTMTTKGGKLDSGRTHIKLAYNLYRYFGGTGEHYRDFIEIYSNWRIKSKTSAKKDARRLERLICVAGYLNPSKVQS